MNDRRPAASVWQSPPAAHIVFALPGKLTR
jgi:hypothetical protein